MNPLAEEVSNTNPRLWVYLLQGKRVLLYAYQLLVNQDGYSTSYLLPGGNPPCIEEEETCRRLGSIVSGTIQRIPRHVKKAACTMARNLPPGELSIPVFCAFVFVKMDESGAFEHSVDLVGDPTGAMIAGFSQEDLDRICNQFLEEVG